MAPNRTRRYWAFRINQEAAYRDKNLLEFYKSEALDGRLRQGWGYCKKHNLRRISDSGNVPNELKPNLKMFNEVKRDDIILVPNLPGWQQVSIFEATEDWNVGYDFQIPEPWGDYGHIFPVQCLRKFAKHGEHVGGDLRKTFRTPMRFWNLDSYADNIEIILSMDEQALSFESSVSEKIANAIRIVFNREEIQDMVYDEIKKRFEGSEWELVIWEVTKELFPQYAVERVGGTSEAGHGTDILVTIPNINSQNQWAIAIQIKDWRDAPQNRVLNQIAKARKYWSEERGFTVIESIVLFTKIKRAENEGFTLRAQEAGVTVIYEEDLKKILFRFAKKRIGILDDSE